MKERGRLRDRQFWRKKVRGRRETEKTVRKDKQLVNFVKRKHLHPTSRPFHYSIFTQGSRRHPSGKAHRFACHARGLKPHPQARIPSPGTLILHP
jgi:hypothetical protein